MSGKAPIGIGIVGTGRMAATMAVALARRPDVRLAGVSSGSAERACAFGAEFAIPQAVRGVADLCALPGIDLIYVANASRHHAETSLVALESGKPVLCEKPFALDSATGRRVTELAASKGLFFQETLWTLFLPAYRRLDALVRSGRFGTPEQLQFSFGYPLHESDRDRLFDPGDGGILYDRGVYGASFAIRTLGLVAGVTIAAQTGGHMIQLSHANGALSQLAISGAVLLSNAVTVGCSSGLVGLDPPSIGAEGLWSQTVTPAPLGAETGSGLRARLQKRSGLRRLRARLGGGAGREWHPYGAGRYDPMLAAVLAHLHAGDSASEIAPPALSLATLDVLEACARDGAMPQ